MRHRHQASGIKHEASTGGPRSFGEVVPKGRITCRVRISDVNARCRSGWLRRRSRLEGAKRLQGDRLSRVTKVGMRTLGTTAVSSPTPDPFFAGEPWLIIHRWTVLAQFLLRVPPVLRGTLPLTDAGQVTKSRVFLVLCSPYGTAEDRPVA